MNLWNSFLETLFPAACVACGTGLPGNDACCASCRARLPLHATLFCGACRARLPEGRKVCHAETPYLLGAATDYRVPEAQALIRALKFGRIRGAAKPLGEILAAYHGALALPRTRAYLLPVPLGTRRLRARGFNQAEEIARVMGAATGIPLVHALIRTKDTPPQSELAELAERRANVAGCFALGDARAVRGNTIFLVDDVVTSGSTLRAAAEALRPGRPRRIVALVAAKA